MLFLYVCLYKLVGGKKENQFPFQRYLTTVVFCSSQRIMQVKAEHNHTLEAKNTFLSSLAVSFASQFIKPCSIYAACQIKFGYRQNYNASIMS